MLNTAYIIGGLVLLAPGNVVGSNVLNILAVLLLPLLWRGWVLNRWEGLGLVVCYGLYIRSLVP